MYTPAFSAVGDETEARALVAAARSGWLVTTGADGFPVATLLPILWEGSSILAHMARANPQWRDLAGGAPALVIASGPEAYVSPSWYPSKAEHGRVVPTWNYLAVHLTGTVQVHDDPEWVRALVTRLTAHHEAGRPEPWQVADAPPDFIDAQLRAIVGIELLVARVEAKAKLSQNRLEPDRLGVIAGLRGEAHPDAPAVVAAMTDRPGT